MQLPESFPDDVMEEAQRSAARGFKDDHEDRLDIPFVTIDPPGSIDLDQAFHAERAGQGFQLHYAIADVGWFVIPGGAVDRDSRVRGETLYSPDERVTLYPPPLEHAASLLPGETRPCVLWSIQLDGDANPVEVRVARAIVRSRQQLTYEGVQRALDTGGADESLLLLREIGELREARERDRGGVSLNIPAQEVERSGDRYHLGYAAPYPVEGWNAQISLLTGMCAARLMLDGGVGLARTLPEADPGSIAMLRRSARALGVPWEDGRPYPEFIRGLDPTIPDHAALM
ncbi:MAG: RNB domain-containing ribonuclease, partial [Actinomycetota bacterium]|nr:RNB domain-containing ribonuclease [Actinomycetota bacterium]